MHDAPPPSYGSQLSEAPGAGAAKTCGIIAVIAGLSCLCFPLGIILGIVALVKHGGAKRAAQDYPEHYRQPGSTGQILGILGLVFSVVFALPGLGMVSAIAIPALLSQRGRARDKAAVENMIGRLGDLVGQYDRAAEARTPPEQIPPALDAYLHQAAAQDKNPWSLTQPAFNFHIQVVSGLDRAGVESEAEAEASIKGQAVYVLELPAKGQSGYLAGAVRLGGLGRDSEQVRTKVTELE